METFGDSNCHSMSDSFSLYERYLRSFNVVDSFVQENHNIVLSPSRNHESSCEGNIDLSDKQKHNETKRNPLIPDANLADKVSNSLDSDFCAKLEDNDVASPALVSLLDNSWMTTEHSQLTEKSDATDVPVSSEDSKSNCFKHPVFISSTMENSNNAVDSVPLFHTNLSETVFKLPIRELSFNGTIKHVQKLKPIVDPITALTSEVGLSHLEEKVMEHPLKTFNVTTSDFETCGQKSSLSDKTTESSECSIDNHIEKCMESLGDSQNEEFTVRIGQIAEDEVSSNMGQADRGQLANDEVSSNVEHFGRSQIANDEGSSNMGHVRIGPITNDEGSSDMDHISRDQITNDAGSSNIDYVSRCQIANDEGSTNTECVCREPIADDEGSSNTDCVSRGQIAIDEESSNMDCVSRGPIGDDEGSLNTDCVSRGPIANYEGSTNMDCIKTAQIANDDTSSNMGDVKRGHLSNDEGSSTVNHSYSSMEASFDSGVRSPDIFSEDDPDEAHGQQPLKSFWSFLKDYEAYDKKRVKKLETSVYPQNTQPANNQHQPKIIMLFVTQQTLQGILPPPSVTTLKTDVTDMLKKYYGFLPLFNNEPQTEQSSVPLTPSKRVSFVQIPSQDEVGETGFKPTCDIDSNKSMESKEEAGLMASAGADKSFEIKLSTEIEMKETAWPDILKCRYYDVKYNMSPYCERLELLSMRYGQRFVGAETESSLTVWAAGLQSPSSASKRKALRLKAAQAKSPGRRLSHLARRRQAFASAATIGEKAHTTSRMVYIDKKKLVSSERKSPRTRRTPGKRTPSRKTPGKKSPRKTPKSGGSSKKKAMRRLLMDSDGLTRSQPHQNTIKRALFISPDGRKSVPEPPSSSVPIQAMKSKRALFSSPVTAETKSLDGSVSDQFMKRKLSALDEEPETSRSKMSRSLSFGGDTVSNRASSSQQSFVRRASEFFASKSSAELTELHKKKLLWAVSEALRVHGWRLSSPGFREKASALARLTRRLLTMPAHAARLAAPNASTSDTMLKLARQYVFAVIQGRTVEECYLEEQAKLANGSTKVAGYISAAAYQQMRKPATTTCASQIKENLAASKLEQPRIISKNILQDKLVNIDSNSNSSSGLSMIDKSALFKSNSMPSFEEAKMRARRQISFDNVDFPKR